MLENAFVGIHSLRDNWAPIISRNTFPDPQLYICLLYSKIDLPKKVPEGNSLVCSLVFPSGKLYILMDHHTEFKNF